MWQRSNATAKKWERLLGHCDASRRNVIERGKSTSGYVFLHTPLPVNNALLLSLTMCVGLFNSSSWRHLRCCGAFLCAADVDMSSVVRNRQLVQKLSHCFSQCTLRSPPQLEAQYHQMHPRLMQTQWKTICCKVDVWEGLARLAMMVHVSWW